MFIHSPVLNRFAIVLEREVSNEVVKSAKDAKLLRLDRTIEDCEGHQRD